MGYSKLVILLAGTAALGNLFGALIFARVQTVSHHIRYSLLGFSGGFLMAVAMLDLVPALLVSQGRSIMFYVLAGFFMMLIIQRWIEPSLIHTHHVEEHELWLSNHQHLRELIRASNWTFAVLFGLGLHSLLDGVLLGSALLQETQLGYMVFIAILIHKFPVGLTMAAVMVVAGHAFRWILASAALLGGLTVLGASLMGFLQAWVQTGLGISAGTLLYVATVEFLPIVHHAPRRWYSLTVLIGLFIGMLVSHMVHVHP